MDESIFPACLLPAINLSLQNPPVSEAGVGEGTSAMSPFTFVFCLVFCPEKSRNSNPCRNSRKEQCKHNAFGRKVDVTAAAAESLQSCPTLCDPMDGSPPGSPVPRILKTRTLEWAAISFSNA